MRDKIINGIIQSTATHGFELSAEIMVHCKLVIQKIVLLFFWYSVNNVRLHDVHDKTRCVLRSRIRHDL